MATDFTPNYNLDKYTATDKPNLRDQYNAAMDKIDNALLSANTNATEAKNATLNFQTQLDGKATTAQLNTAIGNEATARANADAAINDMIGSGFDSTDTVAAWINRLKGALPIDSFNTSHTVEDAIAETAKRRFVCFGDSYGSGTYRNSANTGYGNSPYGWLTYMETTIKNMGFCDVVTNRSSIIPGNSGFTSSGTFLAYLNDMLDRNVIQDPETITDVICLAGTNDKGSSESTIQSAVATFCQRVKSVMPNANIVVGVFANTIAGTDHVANGYRNGCELYGGHYAGSTRFLAHKRDLISPDGVHPSESAYTFYLPYLLDVCFNGDCDYRIITDLEINAPTGFTISNLKARTIVTPNEFSIQYLPITSTNILATVTGDVLPNQTIEFSVPNMPFLPSYSELIGTASLYANMPNPSGGATTYWYIAHVGNMYCMGGTPTTLRLKKQVSANIGSDHMLLIDFGTFPIWGETL